LANTVAPENTGTPDNTVAPENTGARENTGALAGAPAGRFELVASYGDFDETTALDAPSAWRMVLVLRNT
jgi:hypothetical protein